MNMMLYYRLLLFTVIYSLFVGCISPVEEESRLPHIESTAIRHILQLNGYSIKDDENVDNYLKWSHSGDGLDKNYAYYTIVIPKEGNKELLLTDDINMLSSAPSRLDCRIKSL